MPTISQLTATDTLIAGDLFVVYVQNNGDARKAAISVLQTYMQDNLIFPESSGIEKSITQYSSPVVNDFTVILTDTDDNAWLVLSPSSGFALGTFVLPNVTNAIDKQEILITSTQAVVALTININGATAIIGAPLSIIAGGFFRIRFEGPTRTWYRVG